MLYIMKRRVYVNKTDDNHSRGSTMARFIAGCQGMTARDRRNSRTTNWWLAGWMVSFLATSFALKGEHLSPGPLAWLAVGTCTALGLIVGHYYLRFIREADELLRKIQLEALAIGFGAAFIGHFTLSLVERVRGQVFETGDLFMLMVFFYIVGIIAGTRRYA